MLPGPGLSVFAFSAQAFYDAVRHSQGAPPSPVPHPVEQVKYLAAYLGAPEVDAKAMVVERGYLDRHFMDEHSAYHGTCADAPPNYCSRIHFFSQPLTQQDLDGLLVEGNENAAALVQLRTSYLGFTCIRPLTEAPIGRTILRPYPAAATSGERVFGGISKNQVHLGSIELEVKGLPFQQQDRRVGACATTATWSALACVAKSDGDRPPTPSEVTDAAVQFQVSGGRPYPSGGLEIEQICQAIHSLGRAPDLVSGERFPIACLMMLPAFMRSGIPVVVAMAPVQRVNGGVTVLPNEDGHAVTCVGYKHDPKLSPLGIGGPLQFPATQFNQVYVHDDTLGPYARAQVTVEQFFVNIGPGGAPVPAGARVCLTLAGISGTPPHTSLWMITHLIAPLYPKVRTSVVELFQVGSKWIEAVVRAHNLDPAKFSLNARISKGGKFLSDLRRDGSVLPPPAGRAKFLKSVSLSRYVGVVEIGFDGQPWIEMLWDTTDRVSFDPQKLTGLRGVVVRSASVPQLPAWLASRGIPVAS